MSEHIVKAFDGELAELRSLIDAMGHAVLDQIDLSFEGLRVAEATLAERAIQRDTEVDTLFRQVEERVIVIIAKRQPVASDLRAVMATIKIAADLERVGDLAKNISKRSVALADRHSQFTSNVLPVGELAHKELASVLEAFRNLDAKAALAVWESDEEVDDLYNSAFRQLLTYMLENPRNIGTCTHLLFIAKNMERIGDHATNIAEQICYLMEGRTPSGSRPKREG